MGEKFGRHIRETLPAREHFTGPEILLLLCPGSRFCEHLLSLVPVQRSGLPVAISVLINVGEVVLAAVLPPVNPVPLALLWHGAPLVR